MNLKKAGLIVVILCVVFFGWKLTHPKKAVAPPTIVSASIGTLTDSIAASGIVEPRNRVSVMPPLSGRVDSVTVSEGDYVKKGQVLAWMSSTDRATLLDAALNEGPARYKYWEKVYQPTPLIAPISGYIIVRGVENGQAVNPNSAAMVIADKLIVRAQIDETDIGRVKLGQSVRIDLDAYPALKVAGVVDHVSYESKSVNNVTIYQVEVVLRNIPAMFRSGMNANVSIIRSIHKNVLTLPEQAIQYRNGKTFVLVKQPKGARPKKVKTGLSENGNIEILSGIATTDKILIPSVEGASTKKTNNPFFNRPGSNRKTR